MIIPVRCFTCGKVIGDKWDYFNEKKTEKEKLMKEAKEKAKKQQADKGKDDKGKDDTIEELAFNESWGYSEILDELGLNRICCRRHMLGHVNLIDII